MEKKYEDLLEYYLELFPVEEVRIRFIEALAWESPAVRAGRIPRILDMGCSAGITALALARRGLSLTGIDHRETLIRSATRRTGGIQNNPRFFCMDMWDCRAYFSPASFDMILCLRDEFPLLGGREEACSLFRQIHELLAPGGIFVFELANYDRVLEEGLTELPPLKSLRVRYTRSYAVLGTNRVRLTASLRSFNGYPLFIEEHHLYPLGREELTGLLEENRFSENVLYQDFERTPLSADSLRLVGSSVK
jgi:SAM-dependent methyltransferase